MSGKNNVNPDHYKLAGGDRQPENIGKPHDSGRTHDVWFPGNHTTGEGAVPHVAAATTESGSAADAEATQPMKTEAGVRTKAKGSGVSARKTKRRPA